MAINEVYYHPLNDRDEEHEYIELVNTTNGPIDLKSYRFSTGIDFTSSESRVLGPGEFLVVCRDEEAVRAQFGITNTIGNYTGQLSNSGERITLVDPNNVSIDSVAYDEDGEWPYAADGGGPSLEKIVLTAPGDDPSNWDTPRGEGGFQHLVVEGPLRATPTERVLIVSDGAGEFLIFQHACF